MDFGQALQSLKHRLKVRRAAWCPGVSMFILSGNFLVKDAEGYKSPWTPEPSDILAEDWQIHVPRPGEK